MQQENLSRFRRTAIVVKWQFKYVQFQVSAAEMLHYTPLCRAQQTFQATTQIISTERKFLCQLIKQWQQYLIASMINRYTGNHSSEKCQLNNGKVKEIQY